MENENLFSESESEAIEAEVLPAISLDMSGEWQILMGDGVQSNPILHRPIFSVEKMTDFAKKEIAKPKNPPPPPPEPLNTEEKRKKYKSQIKDLKQFFSDFEKNIKTYKKSISQVPKAIDSVSKALRDLWEPELAKLEAWSDEEKRDEALIAKWFKKEIPFAKELITIALGEAQEAIPSVHLTDKQSADFAHYRIIYMSACEDALAKIIFAEKKESEEKEAEKLRLEAEAKRLRLEAQKQAEIARKQAEEQAEIERKRKEQERVEAELKAKANALQNGNVPPPPSADMETRKRKRREAVDSLTPICGEDLAKKVAIAIHENKIANVKFFYEGSK